MRCAAGQGTCQHPNRPVPYLLNSAPGRLHRAPLAFAHRGADPARENTMGAFHRAVALGFRYLEIDVRTSSDGRLVIFHDETLERVTNGAGRLSDHTWDQLSRLRVTSSVEADPTDTTSPGAAEPLVLFEEALVAFPDTHFNVDLKDKEAAAHFAEIVDRLGAHHRVLATSFKDSRRHHLNHLLAQPVATSGGWTSVALMVLLGPLGGFRRISRRIARIDCVQVPIRHTRIPIVRPKFVRRCHRAGLQVHVWVVDDPVEMHRLLDIGVDGIMTDDAEALAGVMRQRSVWPQTDSQPL
ncbi:glycerophosphodiester phosphodiesterase [Nesterenkonia natronophila]|uniref:Glycerophosphodiester phosphodiesterase n=1 Tax=Nesterenkonia natronophila TaxID=2174932 RepID=A0A3A4F1Z8_9MICC|nr:glycerophosphodiester phosphodiesterase [Nesterenkonia natronophila]RJN32302.1 glycerophosphodiester phosphodiesterase [Nesterenkonia natronophila]